MQFAQTKRSLYRNTLFIFTALLFFSCQKEFSIDNGSVVQPPNFSTKVSSSVSGFVTDENNVPVIGATVQFGTSTITTDKYGYFEAKNVQVVKTAAVVTVTRPGYFKGIKTYMAEQGKAAFFRIKLIPKIIAGTVNGNTGGVVSLPNGLSITFPANGVINASSSVAYTGTVNVAAHWLDPAATDLPYTMPGDLRGINTAGNLQLLTTYGMAAVELTGSGGELLQIATGKKATLSLDIPASLLSSAPASIPLWYFDEAKGLWKEEGSATKSGNKYSGEVSHFSFWNYDTPANYVNFDCTVIDPSNNPVPFTLVRISMANNPNIWRFGHTDANGYVSGPVPDNAQLILEVYSTSTYICTAAYSQTFTTTNSNISLGNITVTPNASWASVSGTVTDCSNNPVTNGYVMARINNTYYGRYYLNNAGHFYFTHSICNTTSASIDLLAVDLNNMQESNIMPYTINWGANNIGNIMACGNTSLEFVNYSINSVSHSITDSVYHGGGTTSMNVYATTIANTNYAGINFNPLGIAVNSVQNLTSFVCKQITEQTNLSSPISVNITEYGSVGQFISGNFTGTLTGIMPPNNTYAITCSFRVRRGF